MRKLENPKIRGRRNFTKSDRESGIKGFEKAWTRIHPIRPPNQSIHMILFQKKKELAVPSTKISNQRKPKILLLTLP